MKQQQQELKYKLQALQKRVASGSSGGAGGSASHMDESDVSRMYGEEIKDLKAENEVLLKKINEKTGDQMSIKWKMTTLQRKLEVANKKIQEFESRSGCTVGSNDKWVYLCNANQQVYRRHVDAAEWTKPENRTWTLVKGTLRCISAGDKHLWGTNAKLEILLADAEGDPSSMEWKKVEGPPAIMVEAADKFVYMSTPTGEVHRAPIDGKGAWEKVPGYPIPPEISFKLGDKTLFLDFEDDDTIGTLKVKLQVISYGLWGCICAARF
jgi:hypothetical protein